MNRRQILASTGAVASLGLCAGIVAGVPGCTAAPAAEPIGPGLAFAIERHRSALEALNATCRLLATCEKAERVLRTPETRSALKAVEDAEVIDNTRLSDARMRLLAEPVATMAEVRAKARYLAEYAPDFAPGYDTDVLLASMGASTENLSAVSIATAEPDPLLAVVTAYKSGLATFDGNPVEHTEEEADALRDATWGPHYDTLCSAPPAATTLAGALAGIRLVLHEEETCGHREDFTTNTLRAALAFFDGRA